MLRADFLSKSFEPEMPLLDKVELDVQPGQIHVVAGESGSGKTTLLRMLRGELAPDCGQVRMEGQNLARLTGKGRMQVLRRIAMIHEQDQLLADRTVIENIALPLRILGIHGARLQQRMDEVLQLFRLERKAFLFAGQLSAGERRLASFARAVSAWPKILLADEPFAHLDSIHGKRLMRILLELTDREGPGVVLATHHLDWIPPHERILHHQILQAKLVQVNQKHEDLDIPFPANPL